MALLELALVGLAGAPARQLEVLRGLGEVGADPLASLLALLALAAEGLAAYLLLVVALRAVALLPGAVGRLAGGATLLVAPATVRRALDALVGGALLAQSALAPLPGAVGASPDPTRPVVALAAFGASAGGAAFVVQATADPEGSAEPLGPEGSREAQGGAPVRRADGDRDRVAPVPLPPWLGGERPAPPKPVTSEAPPPDAPVTRGPRGDPTGASLAGGAHRRGPVGPEDRDAPGWRDYTVILHDTLWGIAAARLPAGSGSAATIDRYWRQIYATNRAAIGADPDLIHPGIRLAVPPYRPGGR